MNNKEFNIIVATLYVYFNFIALRSMKFVCSQSVLYIGNLDELTAVLDDVK